MDYLLPTFKTVSVMFAIAAVATGAHAVVDPVGFSRQLCAAEATQRGMVIVHIVVACSFRVLFEGKQWH